MENVLVDRSAAGGHEFRRRAGAGGGGCSRRLAVTSPATPPRGAGGLYSSFPYHFSAPPFQPPYAAYHHNLCSSPSLPVLPSHHPALLPRPPPARHTTFPYRPVTLPPLPPAGAAAAAAAKVKQTTATGMTSVPAAAVMRKVGEYKRKKPRTPRSAEESPAARRRKPLQRAAPLPAATAVTEALDDLEREVTRGFVEDLLHALAPPPSSLPLPTFSLVRAAAGAKAAAPSCAV